MTTIFTQNNNQGPFRVKIIDHVIQEQDFFLRTQNEALIFIVATLQSNFYGMKNSTRGVSVEDERKRVQEEALLKKEKNQATRF